MMGLTLSMLETYGVVLLVVMCVIITLVLTAWMFDCRFRIRIELRDAVSCSPPKIENGDKCEENGNWMSQRLRLDSFLRYTEIKQ